MIKKVMGAVYNFLYNRILPVAGQIMVSRNRYCNVIYYHDIVEGDGVSCMYINIDKFKFQMRYLKEQGFEFLRFDDFVDNDKLRFKKKRILIAFDDGWLSNYSAIFQWMRDNNIKYNIFLTIGEVGSNSNYINWDMAREMHKSGIVGFGAHTFTHPDMSDIEAIDWQLEIDKANELFSKELGFEPADFCYPYGYFSKQSNKRLITSSTYTRIYLSESMYTFEKNNKIIFGRTGIKGEIGHKGFVNAVNGYDNLNYLYARLFHRPILSVYHLFHKSQGE